MTTMPLQKPLSPAPSYSSSAASFSSFSCSTKSKFSITPSSISSSSSSSSSSCSSSTMNTKDRSFSNEFLRSCVKDNPHVISSKPTINEKNIEKTVINSNKIHPQIHHPSSLVSSPKLKQSIQHKTMITVSSTPKKRARSNSPTPIIRQKSFRKEQCSATSIPNRGLRSPSPSRRFNTENSKSFSSKGSSPNNNHCSSGMKRESFRAKTASPNRDIPINRNFSLRKMDTFSQQVSRKIEGVHTGDIKCSQEMDIVMEDVNNPLIALDCFIFL
ncbi:hypothetical protein BUALT_Bualt08G0111800 [Buddleja alternifolia]|uniref:Uncharacterized protein n=1 Tax=Buddleja alternifolia TaxID=168488 RepID=A0AAV6XCP7_9LAMI|nr:hypothetical protein BUALT_Bualt08G0111800 [Buddleja alternifolia]